MNIPAKFISRQADYLISNNDFARKAYSEIEDSILQNHTESSSDFTINNSEKNCNGLGWSGTVWVCLGVLQVRYKCVTRCLPESHPRSHLKQFNGLLQLINRRMHIHPLC